MKLFLDRNKTLLPRIDVIFLLTRIMTFLVISWFGLFGDYAQGDARLFLVVSATYAILIIIFFASMRGKFDLKLAYLGTVIYDMIFLPLFTIYTGGLDSSFYLLFFLTVSVAAYVLTFYFAFAVTFLSCASYVAAVFSQLTVDDVFSFSIRIGFMWISFLALSYVSQYMRKSEQRLLKLFDTLNMRTSELEKSQAQLEMIYENTRILASILEPENVVREVMRIMGQTLQYGNCALVLIAKNGEYYYRARSINGNPSFHRKAFRVAPTDLLSKIAVQGGAIRVKDLGDREDYDPMNENARSLIISPMNTHGETKGLLVAESTEKEAFSDRDEQMLSVVARSAGLALENADLHKRTEEMSIIDELTGSFNYRYFIQKFQEEKKRAVRYDLPLSIIMVDIDWFKKLNDGYGHEVGNIVLKSLAGVIQGCIRDVDIFSRYGGEEFVVILPQTPQSEAVHIGERIREQVENHVIDAGTSGKLKITVSVGVSSFPENGRSEEELVSVADQALYQAKDSGKNLVRAV
ncbi:MAG: diguanylate cyclase [bacterium]|nr:diguanylate cyclase [bacterium]